MAGKIAAVDGRHIMRMQNGEVARVIPVVEVALELLHLLDRLERFFEPLDAVDETDPAMSRAVMVESM